mmetsp:Transcript_20190/g.47073  ORF Transcript_20190/g.47073 Transcript_20190/m.47073 type:complete len:264 (-) Transcript_20190:632-1423(-)
MTPIPVVLCSPGPRSIILGPRCSSPSCLPISVLSPGSGAVVTVFPSPALVPARTSTFSTTGASFPEERNVDTPSVLTISCMASFPICTISLWGAAYGILKPPFQLLGQCFSIFDVVVLKPQPEWSLSSAKLLVSCLHHVLDALCRELVVTQVELFQTRTSLKELTELLSGGVVKVVVMQLQHQQLRGVFANGCHYRLETFFCESLSGEIDCRPTAPLHDFLLGQSLPCFFARGAGGPLTPGTPSRLCISSCTILRIDSPGRRH